MKKNLICILLALVLVLGLMVISAPNANAAEAHSHCYCVNAEYVPEDHECITQEWTAVTATKTISADGAYFLDWTGNKAASITVNKNVNAYLCLNGARIYAGTTIKLNAGATLTICDCSTGGSGSITVSGGAAASPLTVAGSQTVNLYSGNITGTGNGKSFASVSMSSSTAVFNMYGGSITGGSSEVGGNVSLTRGIFTMYGGTISGGKAVSEGGNVAVHTAGSGTSKFVMNGGTISGGSAVGQEEILDADGTVTQEAISGQGGNVSVSATVGVFEMNGGTIENGTAALGGNVYSSTGSTLTATGGTISGGSAANGGSIYAKNNITLSGISISGGTATGNGGNIWSDKTVTINEGTVISNGNATSNGGNIYVNGTSSKLDMTAGKIENGTAGNTGGNIYTLNSPNVLISGGSISNGSALNGGNLYVTHGTLVGTRKLEISNTKISGGNAEGGNGGNLYISRVGQVTLTDVTMENGVATQSGSNLYVQLSHNVTINGGTYSVAAGGRNYTYDAEKHAKYSQEEIETYGLNNAGTRITGNGGNICISSCSSIETTVDEVVTTTEGSAAITGAAIIGGNAVNGGALYVGNANVTLDGITAKSCGGGSGRALYVAKNAVVTVKDSTLINWGTVGTAIVNHGTLNLEGTVNLSKEYNANERLAQTNGTAPSVTLDLLVDTTENENAVIDISGLTAVDETITVNRYGGEIEADGTKHTQPGLVATGANDTNAALITCAHAGYTLAPDGSNINLVAYAVQGMSGTDVVIGYASLADINENDGATWYILNSDLEGQTVSKSILLDLCGNDLTAELSEGVVVSVIDSANDKYDASACGKLTVSGSGTVEAIVHTTASKGGAIKHYVLLKNEDGSYSAHRYVAAVVAVSLDPNNDALGYKASFSADEAARAAVTGYGFNLWVEDGAAKTYAKNGSFNEVGSVLTLRLRNIMAVGGGEMTINGNAFINFNVNGETVTASTSNHSTSMKQTINAINDAVAANAEAYTETQMTALKSMIAKFKDYMTDWQISSIEAWTAPV